MATPVIGLVVGAVIQDRFAASTGNRRRLLPLISLYLGATLFGLAVGVGNWIVAHSRQVNGREVIGESVVAVWWGVTATGFLLFLWPLAYGTHWLLQWRAES